MRAAMPGPKIEFPEEEIEQPNFHLTGALERDNAIRYAKRQKLGRKYGKGKSKKLRKYSSLPHDSALPKEKWRLYIFEKEKKGDTVNIFNRQYYLLGRKKKIANIRLQHISSSNEHAVIQFRLVQVRKKAVDGVLDIKHGMEKYTVRPYLMDLQSTNGTYVNGNRIQHSRYYELMDSDVITFGVSDKEYVIMKGMELSKAEEEKQEGNVKDSSKGGVFGV
eukprot:g2262.t1